ncbi:MAG: MMPL family transporter, partial [Nitrospinaceae bacterium]
GLSLWYTATHLGFNTKRSDLISRDLPYDILYQRYRAEFENFDGMTIAVEGEDPDAMKGFAEALARRLQKHRDQFSEIFYKVDTEYFKNRALLFLDMPELRDLAEKLRGHQTFLENVNAAPGLNTLLFNINREISVGMVDTLMSGFLGTDEDAGDDTADLSLLVSLLQQMIAHVNGESRYRSLWASFFTDREETLKEEGYLVSGNEKLLFILLNPVETQGDFAGSKKAIDQIRGLIRETRADYPDLKVGLTGSDVIASDEMFTTMLDVKLASQIALVGVALLFIAAYRGVVKPLLAVASLLVALAWAMGYTTLTVGHLNIISVVFTTILIGLGIDFGIHILERYREERRAGAPVRAALLNTLKGTGRGNLAGAIAFGAMAFTNFIGIAELGIIAAGGILLCWLGMVLFLPALVCLEERWRRLDYPPSANGPRKEKLLNAFYARYLWIIAVCLLLLVWAGGKVVQLRFDYNLLNLQAQGTEAVTWELKILENAKRATWYVAVITDTLEAARQKYDAIRQLPSAGKVDSLFSAIPEDQEEKIPFIRALAQDLPEFEIEPEDAPFSLQALRAAIKKIRFKLRKKESTGPQDDVAVASSLVARLGKDLDRVDAKTAQQRLAAYSTLLFLDYRKKITNLQTALHPEPVQVDRLPKLLRQRFLGRTGKHLILVYPAINIWERPALERFLNEIRAIDPTVTGNAVHMFESSQLMIQGYVQGGIYAMAGIILYLLASLRNVPAVLLVLIPTLAGSIWTVGCMDLLGVQFNMANLVILPLIIGIGVVNGVHILHRFRESPGAENNVLSKSTGQAVVLSSLTTMVGFGSLMTADHRGVYSLGLVLTLGVGCCLLASVTLLPAMLRFCTLRGWRL